MNKLVLVIMIFLHIVDDFYLQGIFTKLKQKSWWEENCPESRYRFDYKMALLEHSFSWSFVVMLPIMVNIVATGQEDLIQYYLIFFAFNTIAHAIIDNAKANDRTINLIFDQILHIGQVVLTWCYFFVRHGEIFI